MSVSNRDAASRIARRLSGWLPAIILPVATLDQIITLVVARSSTNLSMTTWLLFLLANLGALALTRPASRLETIQVSLAFGLTAALDVVLIVAIAALR